MKLHRLAAAPEREVPRLEVVLAQLPAWQAALRNASIPFQRELLIPQIEQAILVRLR